MRTYALQLAATSVRWPRPDDKVILRLLFMRGWPSQLINNIFAAWVASHSAAHLCVQFFAHIFHGAHVALSACTITNSWMPPHTATQPPNHLFLYAFSSWVAHFIVQEECGEGALGQDWRVKSIGSLLLAYLASASAGLMRCLQLLCGIINHNLCAFCGN